jgi:cytochrome c
MGKGASIQGGIVAAAGWAGGLAAIGLATGVGPALALAGTRAEAAYGAYLAAECAACHRPDTAGGAIPSLHRLPYDRLVAALEAYRDGTRVNPTMQAVARSLGDAEIEALAAYFSGRP